MPYFVICRYSEASCDSQVPTPTEENYAGFNLGPPTISYEISSENEDSAFDSPKELNSRNPPFDIQLSFSRYRAGKQYESKVNFLKCLRTYTSIHTYFFNT